MIDMSTSELIALDDSRTAAGISDLHLKGIIRKRYDQAVSQGYVHVQGWSFEEWLLVYRDANTEHHENLEAAGELFDKLIGRKG